MNIVSDSSDCAANIVSWVAIRKEIVKLYDSFVMTQRGEGRREEFISADK